MTTLGPLGEYALLSAKYRSGPSEEGAASFVQLARTAYDSGHVGFAERCLRRALDLAPDSPQLHTGLGSLEYELGKVSDAQQNFARALELDPELGSAQYGMAASLQALGMASDAVYYYLSYLRQNPSDVTAMIYLAGAFASTGQYEEAVELFERACALDADNPQIHGLYGRTLFEIGRIRESAVRLGEAIRLGSTDSEVYRTLGLALEDEGRLDEARTALERAVEIDPRNVNARTALANLLTQIGDFRRGAEQAREAVAVAKDDGRPDEEVITALWQLGWAYYMLGDWRASAEASGQALAIDSSLASVRFNLGLALLREGRSEEAFAEYKTAVAAVEDAWDLRIVGIEDLKGALAADPDLEGGARILELLEDRYRELGARRSSPVPT